MLRDRVLFVAVMTISLLGGGEAAVRAQEKAVAGKPATEKPLHKFLPIEDKSNVSLAYIWLDIAEEATAQDVDRYGARPTIISRTLAIWATAMYDAWAAYDPKA